MNLAAFIAGIQRALCNIAELFVIYDALRLKNQNAKKFQIIKLKTKTHEKDDWEEPIPSQTKQDSSTYLMGRKRPSLESFLYKNVEDVWYA